MVQERKSFDSVWVATPSHRLFYEYVADRVLITGSDGVGGDRLETPGREWAPMLRRIFRAGDEDPGHARYRS